MLKISYEDRSYRILETESGVQFIHYKSLRAFDKNLYNYNELGENGPFCKGTYEFLQDDDFRLFIYYTDGSTYDGESKVKSIRINSISSACVSTPCGEEFYGNLWKITYNEDLDCYFLREESEDYDDEVDVYCHGELIEEAV